MFRIRKTDMSANHSTFILDSANLIRDRPSSSDEKIFLRDLKHILDSRFGGDWNLLIGRTVGYAMKTKKKSSIILSDASHRLLVCWKSPGFEVEDLNVVKVKTSIAMNERDPLFNDPVSSTIKVLTIPEPDQFGYSQETTRTLAILEAVSKDISDMEYDDAARHVRNQYVLIISRSECFI
jgi:hypothetical protein